MRRSRVQATSGEKTVIEIAVAVTVVMLIIMLNDIMTIKLSFQLTQRTQRRPTLCKKALAYLFDVTDNIIRTVRVKNKVKNPYGTAVTLVTSQSAVGKRRKTDRPKFTVFSLKCLQAPRRRRF